MPDVATVPAVAEGAYESAIFQERSCSTPGHVTSMHLHRDVAGATFYHEERTLGRDPVNGYHIYFHPRRDRLEPAVQFLEPGLPPLNEWRLLASKAGTPLLLRSQADVHDGRFTAGSHHFPMDGTGLAPRVLLVFEGTLRVGSERLWAGDILALPAEQRTFHIDAAADLLLIHDRAKVRATSRC
ncbi:hypothetical protein [Rhizobium leguminosarum]|uniref:hypothetical protein n=1 Tax=Rhizobium leguminosarum TaxID=384 RepID=UPI0015FA3A01|nr:hypothetical protein [Rhizobium leguminosarum]MBA9035822.1 redox-sensitive bicupin YhaK (pirin superfamily) [Rhizobium leguminosarum]